MKPTRTLATLALVAMLAATSACQGGGKKSGAPTEDEVKAGFQALTKAAGMDQVLDMTMIVGSLGTSYTAFLTDGTQVTQAARSFNATAPEMSPQKGLASFESPSSTFSLDEVNFSDAFAKAKEVGCDLKTVAISVRGLPQHRHSINIQCDTSSPAHSFIDGAPVPPNVELNPARSIEQARPLAQQLLGTTDGLLITVKANGNTRWSGPLTTKDKTIAGEECVLNFELNRELGVSSGCQDTQKLISGTIDTKAVTAAAVESAWQQSGAAAIPKDADFTIKSSATGPVYEITVGGALKRYDATGKPLTK